MTLWVVSNRLLVVSTLRLLVVIPILGLLVIRVLVVAMGIVVLLLRLLVLVLLLVLVHPKSNMALCQHAYNEGSSSKLHLDGIV